MRDLNVSEQNSVSAGSIISDVNVSERTLTIAGTAGGLVLGSVMGTLGAFAIAGCIVAGHMFYGWAK